MSMEAICARAIDVLVADARLYRGGNAYAAGWAGGVSRNPVAPAVADNKVLVFDHPYASDSTNARPAIYVGANNDPVSEREDFPAVASVPVEFFVLRLPLYFVVDAPTQLQARAQLNQLRGNAKYILLGQRRDPLWYLLEIGKGGGGPRDSVKVTSPGSAQAVATAIGVLSVSICYEMVGGGVTA